MLFGSSFSGHTKKLFRKSIESFKSFLSGGYTKLIPTSPPCQFCTLNPFSCSYGGDTKFRHSYRELDNFYAAYTKQWRANYTEELVAGNEINNHPASTYSTPTGYTAKVDNEDSEMSTNVNIARKNYRERKKRSTWYERKLGKEKQVMSDGRDHDQKRGERIRVVAEKLKELETMDGGNMEHVLDIEEVIHYYSRLTCPAFLQIIDKYFTETYTEFSNLQQAANYSGRVNVSRPRRRMRSVRSVAQ